MTGKGNCEHGVFILGEGCPQCLEARRVEEAQVNSEANIAKRIKEATAKVGEPVAIRAPLRAPLIVEPKGTAIVKVDPGIAPSFAKHLDFFEFLRTKYSTDSSFLT